MSAVSGGGEGGEHAEQSTCVVKQGTQTLSCQETTDPHPDYDFAPEDTPVCGALWMEARERRQKGGK